MELTRRSLLTAGASAAALGALGMPAVRAQDEAIKIGIMFPLSGPQAQVGEAWSTGAQIAVEQVNKAGGLLGRQLQAVVRDDKGNAAGAVAAAREFNDLGVRHFIGAGQSPMALALVPVLEELGAILVGTATAMSLTHENFTKNFFRINPNAHMFYSGLGQVMATKYPDVDSWASIVFDGEAGRDAIAAFKAGLARTSKAKLTFTETIFASPTATDFKVEISKIMSSGVKGLYLGLVGGPAISFLQQARSVGLTEKLTAIGEGGTDLSLGRALQKSMPTNVWGRGYWYPQNPAFSGNPISQQLYADYVAKTNDKFPLGVVQLGHKMGQGLFAGIRKAGAFDVPAVIAAMEGLQFECAEGTQKIRKEDHQALGNGHYANYGPSEEAPYHTVREVVDLADESTVEPPSPGVAFKRG